MQHTILCIDDEPDICDALERLFRKQYRVLKSTSAKDALEILKNENVTVIISDQRMPNMTGVQFFKESIKTHPLTVRILLTGYADIESVIEAINSGQIYRYVTKPWDSLDLTTAVSQAVERYELTNELKRKNKELGLALEELKTLDAAKDQFMILINHELKTPLTSLINYVDLLKESHLDEEQKKYLNRIQQSTDRLYQLVHEVLELLTAETNRPPIKLKKVQIRDLFAKAKPYAEKSLLKAQTISFSDTKLGVMADEEKLTKILGRLIHNAIRHGAQNDKISVIAKKLDSTNVEISVENSGQPISEATVKYIMKPFTVNEDIMHHSTGLGLGLSICQAQLKQHGSNLLFKFNDGKVIVGFELKEA